MSTQTVRIAPQGPVVPEWTLADRLRKARQVAGLAQRDFAERIGVGPSAYSQWEAGNNGPRDVVAIARRVELLTRIPAAWILGLADDSRPAPAGGAVWAPWDSNPQPTDYESEQVSGTVVHVDFGGERPGRERVSA